jgi:hypothetical protein
MLEICRVNHRLRAIRGVDQDQKKPYASLLSCNEKSHLARIEDMVVILAPRKRQTHIRNMDPRTWFVDAALIISVNALENSIMHRPLRILRRTRGKERSNSLDHYLQEASGIQDQCMINLGGLAMTCNTPNRSSPILDPKPIGEQGGRPLSRKLCRVLRHSLCLLAKILALRVNLEECFRGLVAGLDLRHHLDRVQCLRADQNRRRQLTPMT